MTVATSGSGLSATGRPGIHFNSSGGAAAGAIHSRLERIARALRTSAIRSLFVLSERPRSADRDDCLPADATVLAQPAETAGSLGCGLIGSRFGLKHA